MQNRLSPALQRNIREVFKAGLSVCEIARTLEVKPVDIHKELVKSKIIPPLKESGRLKPGKVSNEWLNSFTDRGLTIEQWVQGWGFRMSNLSKLFVGKEVSPHEDYVRIIHALGRDLPVRFKLAFRVESQFIVIPEKTEHTKFFVNWVADKNQYVAVALDLMDETGSVVECCGKTAKDAFNTVCLLAEESIQIGRLWDAVAFKDSWEEVVYRS
jgi:hypothetical protein